MAESRPPFLARWLLAHMLSPEDRHPALGDLEEEYRDLVDTGSRREANRWYWSQTRRSVRPSLLRRMRTRLRFFEGGNPSPRQAVRRLLRKPGLAVAAVATLALGIGAATAVFSVAEAVLLRPLPYPRGDRLVQIWNTYDSWRGHEVLDAYWDKIPLSWPEYVELRDHNSTMNEVAVYGAARLPLIGLGNPREAVIGVASSTLFPLLGVNPLLGRLPVADDEGPAASHVAVLAYETWRDSFGSDSSALGSTLTITGTPFTVIGVLPARFHLATIAEPAGPRRLAWVPIGALGEELSPGNHNYEGIGRLKDGVAIEAAHDEVAKVLRGGESSEQRGARLAFRRSEEAGRAREPLLLLFAGVTLLLLIACGNYATLLLGDTLHRTDEFATRCALGARRAAVVLQVVVESTVLGVAAALLGFLLAQGGARLFLRLAPATMALPATVPPNLTVLAFGSLLGLGAGALVGLAPGWSIRTGYMGERLRAGGRSVLRGPQRLQGILLSLQLALSMVLLTGGTQLIRSARTLEATDPGFATTHLWSARVLFADATHSSTDARQGYHEVLARLTGSPGIEAAALISAIPLSGQGGSSSFQIVGREVPESEKKPEALRRTVSSTYHTVMGIPLIAGRLFEETDRIYDAPVVLISRSLAERYWPAGGAVGHFISRDRRQWEIVGVVEDVHDAALDQPAQPTFYVPFDVAERPFGLSVIVRAGLDADQVAGALRTVVRGVDPTVPVEDLTTIHDVVARSTAKERFRAGLMLGFALTATLLCALGLFSATARRVALRRREMGIRLTLGAPRARVVREVLAEHTGSVLAGLLFGLGGALLTGRLLVGLLFGIEPFDPISLAVAVGMLAAAAIGGAALAAERGSRLDPSEALRVE